MLKQKMAYNLLIVFLTLLIVNGCQKIPKVTDELPKNDSTLSLYFIPSPFGINWESPKKLFTSMIFNYFSFRPHFMGHVAIQVSCVDLAQEKHNFITGMSSQKLSAAGSIFFEHSGLGVMFIKNPGRFDDPKESEQEIVLRLKNPGSMSGVNFIKYKISPSACSRIAKYYDEYQKFDIKRYYSLYSRPLYGEGAGCSAYGASFLEVIGVLNDEIKNGWSYSIKLPNRLIGKPFINQNAYFWDVLMADSWAKENEESTELFFWEPDKMFHWVNTKLSDSVSLSPYKEVKIFNTSGLYLDVSNVNAPVGPIWKKTDRTYFNELLEINKQLYESSL